MQEGTVKWFNDGKGYGFITPDNGGGDLFVHFSGIVDNGGRRSLVEGQRVQFNVETGDKGLQATSVSEV